MVESDLPHDSPMLNRWETNKFLKMLISYQKVTKLGRLKKDLVRIRDAALSTGLLQKIDPSTLAEGSILIRVLVAD